MSPEYWRSPDGQKVAAGTVALLAVFGLAACGGGDGADKTAKEQGTATASRGEIDPVVQVDEVVREFAGAVPGTNIYAALVTTEADDADGTGGEDAFVYLCDGAAIAQRFFQVEGNKTRFENFNGGTVSVKVADGQATITGKLNDGTQVDFTIPEVDPDGQPGLYFAGDQELGAEPGDYAGWIVLADGSQRGNAVIGGTVQQAGTLDPGSLTVTGSPLVQVRPKLQGFFIITFP
ncbi:MAG: hypothetical protein ACR2IR_11595 [Acidimicrobiia bacterium]